MLDGKFIKKFKSIGFDTRKGGAAIHDGATAATAIRAQPTMR